MKERGALPNTRRAYWYATEAVSDLNGGRTLSARELVDLFGAANARAGRLIEKSIANPILAPERHHIRDRVPQRPWSRGPVCLAGDAAHACTPDLGQGACQALESAVVLGRCLAAADDFEAAFTRFERLRFARTAHVTEMSRLTAIQSTVTGPFLEPLRELGIRTLLPTITAREFERLFAVEL